MRSEPQPNCMVKTDCPILPTPGQFVGSGGLPKRLFRMGWWGRRFLYRGYKPLIGEPSIHFQVIPKSGNKSVESLCVSREVTRLSAAIMTNEENGGLLFGRPPSKRLPVVIYRQSVCTVSEGSTPGYIALIKQPSSAGRTPGQRDRGRTWPACRVPR